MKQSPFVKSGYKRKKNDHYPTIDSRCIEALLDSSFIIDRVWDCCSINGSGILEDLKRHNKKIYQGKDAYTPNPFPSMEWVVSNPPYKKGEVTKIILAQIERIKRGQIIGVAMLLRTGFDHAKTYQNLFRDCENYAGQIKLTFRPIWIKRKKQKASPIHNYVWHIWTQGNHSKKFVIYSK